MLSIEKQLLYLLSSAGDTDVKQLIGIYGARGISHQVIRNALARLKKDGYIDSLERSRYSLTSLGAAFIETINRKPQSYARQWDLRWHVVLFEVPETERKKRDDLRNDLLQLGFAPLYKSVYVSPWNYQDEVLRTTGHYGLSGCITLSEGVFFHNGITREKAKQLWPLDVLNEQYKAKREWFRSSFLPTLDLTAHGEAGSDLTLFVRFLELGEMIAELGLSDPMLPDELLPEDWLGKECYLELSQCLRTIAMAIPESSVYRSFVARFLEF